MYELEDRFTVFCERNGTIRAKETHMTRTLRIVFLAAFISAVYSIGAPLVCEELSDDKIGDMIKEIEKREKEQKEKEKEDGGKQGESTNSGCGGCGGFSTEGCDIAASASCTQDCMEALGKLFVMVAMSTEYADYPYADNSDFAFSRFKSDTEDGSSIGFLKLTYEPSYLSDGIWGMTGRFEGALTILYASCLYQYNFSDVNRFSVFTFNGGIQIPVSNVALRLFIGGFSMPDVLDRVYISFGGSLEIFFPNNIVFEIYSVNSITDYLQFYILSSSLGVSLWRFTLGAGFSYYNYVTYAYYGPTIKLSFWI